MTVASRVVLAAVRMRISLTSKAPAADARYAVPDIGRIEQQGRGHHRDQRRPAFGRRASQRHHGQLLILALHSRWAHWRRYAAGAAVGTTYHRRLPVRSQEASGR